LVTVRLTPAATLGSVAKHLLELSRWKYVWGGRCWAKQPGTVVEVILREWGGTRPLSNVAAIRNGEWYQDLYGWSRVLELGLGGRLEKVRLEAEDAGHVDDVVAYPRDPARPVEFVQIKFHVWTEAGAYSTDSLVAPPVAVRRAAKLGKVSRARSLLQKFWHSWQELRDHAPGGVALVLVSNWSWARSDPLHPLISGVTDTLGEAFFTSPTTSDIGDARERWRAHLGADPVEFAAFMRAVHFQLGGGSTRVVEDTVGRLMAAYHLRHDGNALKLAVTQVGEWIRTNVETITPALYEQALDQLQLRLRDPEPAVVIDLHTVERQTYEPAADHTIDWCDKFVPLHEGQPFPRGHVAIEDACWERDFLPELRALKETLNGRSAKLLRVRGKARLSAWLAFGRVFERRAGYVLEIDQYGQSWRTDVATVPDMRAVMPGAAALGRGADVAVGVAITNDVTPALQAAVDALQLPVESLLVFVPSTGTGHESIPSAGHLKAFVDSVRTQLAAHLAARGGARVHLFYSGPAAGRCSPERGQGVC
jgi:hypothetical protein